MQPVYIQQEEEEAKPLLKAVHPPANKTVAVAPFFRPNNKRAAPPPQDLQLLELPAMQSKFIQDTMEEIREKELLANRKRRRTTAMLDGNDNMNKNNIRVVSDNWTDIFLDRLSWNPNVAQIVASSGGLITYWNDAFSKVTQKSQKLLRNMPLTIFELIEPKWLPSLYGMLALALHNVPIVVDDESITVPEVASSSHMSITLPCKTFKDSSTCHNITIIFMHDLSSQCFVGVLTPVIEKPSSSSFDCDPITEDDGKCKEEDDANHPIYDKKKTYIQELPMGRMIRLQDDILCQLIFGDDDSE